MSLTTGHLDLSTSCLCGAPVDLVTTSRSSPQQAIAILKCDTCRQELALEVRLGYLAPPRPRPRDTPNRTEMRERRANGATLREIADEYGISVTHTQRLVGKRGGT